MFPSAQVPASLSSISTSAKPPPIAAVNILATVSPFEIVTRRPIQRGKYLFQAFTTTVLSIAEVSDSLSYCMYQGKNHQ